MAGELRVAIGNANEEPLAFRVRHLIRDGEGLIGVRPPILGFVHTLAHYSLQILTIK
jgi:hypothetical protein